jgi:hypothetical protein
MLVTELGSARGKPVPRGHLLHVLDRLQICADVLLRGELNISNTYVNLLREWITRQLEFRQLE